jgi:hypothetical protein
MKFGYTLLMLSFLSLAIKANLQNPAIKSIDSVPELVKVLQATSAGLPVMRALIVYNSHTDDNLDLKRILAAFGHARRARVYQDFIDFIGFDLAKTDQINLSDLKQIVNFDQTPVLILFLDSDQKASLAGYELKQSRVITSFVKQTFAQDLRSLKELRQERAKKIIRFEDHPFLMYEDDFGTPFYAHYLRTTPFYEYYGGYQYPYKYGMYFGVQ